QIDAWMRVEGLSKSGAYKKLRHIWGLGDESRSAWLPYLIDKPVPAELEPALAAIVGWPPEDDAEPEPAPEPDASALGDLAQALQSIAVELKESREERAALRQERADLKVHVAALERSVQLMAERLAALEAKGPGAPRAPRGTEGSGAGR